MIRQHFIRILFWGLFTCLLFSACKQAALYERLKNIPKAEWENGEKLEFAIEIPDTTQSYYLIVTIRHTHQYAYRNVWVKLGLQQPGTDSITYRDFDLPLANNEQWLGVGMDDVYERRIRLFGKPVRFTSTGTARFTLQQIMRDNPLKHVLQAGIRVEPANE
jgi:gliding motility-associated lipoprotein GldH